ncbi:MAG: S24/S26 family peptidase [Candidatus Izemoplasmatales bacterium]
MASKKETKNGILPLIEEQLLLGKQVAFKVKGTSMFPFLHSGRTEVTLHKPTVEPKKYDIVLFKTKDHYVLHRIIKRRRDVYIVMGDALKKKDYVKIDQIIGVVKEIKVDGKPVDIHEKKYKRKVRCWVAFRAARRFLLYYLRRSQKDIK